MASLSLPVEDGLIDQKIALTLKEECKDFVPTFISDGDTFLVAITGRENKKVYVSLTLSVLSVRHLHSFLSTHLELQP